MDRKCLKKFLDIFKIFGYIALSDVIMRTVFAPESTVIMVFPSQHNPVGCENVLLPPNSPSFPSHPTALCGITYVDNKQTCY